MEPSKYDHLYEGEPWAELAKQAGFSPGNTESMAREAFRYCADRIAMLEAEVKDLQISLAGTEAILTDTSNGEEYERKRADDAFALLSAVEAGYSLLLTLYTRYRHAAMDRDAALESRLHNLIEEFEWAFPSAKEAIEARNPRPKEALFT
mgnify:CR=1 FL=1